MKRENQARKKCGRDKCDFGGIMNVVDGVIVPF
jgi:hypothetical protein